MAVAMRNAVNQSSTYARNIVLLSDASAMQGELEKLKKARANYDTAEQALGKMFSELADTTPKEKELFAKLKDLKSTVTPLIDKMVTLGLANKSEEATKLLMKEVSPPLGIWLGTLGELTDFEVTLPSKNESLAEQ